MIARNNQSGYRLKVYSPESYQEIGRRHYGENKIISLEHLTLFLK